MDNIKKFEDFLDRMQGLLDSAKKQGHIIVRVEDLENTFPELKENEDEKNEKVRIGLIKAFNTVGKSEWGGLNMQDILAWLEKQGEPTDINPSEFDLRLNKLLKQFETLSKEELASSLSFYLNVVQNDGTYKAEEKQGEQKPTDEVEPKFKVGDKVIGIISGMQYYITKVCDNHYCTESGCIIMFDAQDNFELVEQQLKKIEQKSTDKVEPKFHKGEWITNGDYTWKIVEVKPLDYILQSQDGDIVDDTISYVDEQFHLFTLQDAKDGDVLVSKYNKPFIYNGNRDFCHVGSYCGLSTSDKFIVSTSKCFWTENMSIRPATKEQHDTLMKAMANAGYTFDFEKKELKKIELTKSESEEELSDFEAALFSAFSDGWQQYLHGEEVDFAQWAKEHSAELLEAANQNHVAWSEEDEEFLRRAIKATKDVYPVTADWLKSLKDRVLPQPKKKWSDEDESIALGIEQIVNCASLLNIAPDRLNKVRDWLKSLKPQNHWKPTEEQIRALHDLNLTGNISYAGQGQVLIELYNDLKKL